MSNATSIDRGIRSIFTIALVTLALIASTAGAAAAAPKGGNGGGGGDKGGGPKSGGPSVSYDSEGDLVVTGNDSNNDVWINDAIGGYEIEITTAGVTESYIIGQVPGDITFDLAGGDDTIFFNLEGLWALGGNAVIDLGDGRNKVHGASGFSTGGQVSFIDGAGASELEIRSHQVGDLRLDLGSGDDSVSLKYVDVDHDVDIQVGSGDDYTYMFGVETGESFSYRGAKGDDTLHIWASVFGGATTLNGGQHTDYVGGEANTFASTPNVSAFEVIG